MIRTSEHLCYGDNLRGAQAGRADPVLFPIDSDGSVSTRPRGRLPRTSSSRLASATTGGWSVCNRIETIGRVTAIALLIVLGTDLWLAAAPDRAPVIPIGPGPFALYTFCLAPQEGPHPTELPFSLGVLEAEMRHELEKQGLPLVGTGDDLEAAQSVNFGACVWGQKHGEIEYLLTLTGPWPKDILGEVEDVSYWPQARGRVASDRLRDTLERETRRLAREFMRAQAELGDLVTWVRIRPSSP